MGILFVSCAIILVSFTAIFVSFRIKVIRLRLLRAEITDSAARDATYDLAFQAALADLIIRATSAEIELSDLVVSADSVEIASARAQIEFVRAEIATMADRSERLKHAAQAELEAIAARADRIAIRMYLGSNIRDDNIIRTAKPPVLAEYVLELLVSPEWGESVAGDFFEKFQRKFDRVNKKNGAFAAKFDYCWQVVRSAPGLLRLRFGWVVALSGLVEIFDVFSKHWHGR